MSANPRTALEAAMDELRLASWALSQAEEARRGLSEEVFASLVIVSEEVKRARHRLKVAAGRVLEAYKGAHRLPRDST